MSEILRKWLSLRLGLVIDYNLQSFEELAYDGTLLANLLYNYGIIPGNKLEYIDKTEDPEIAFANLVFLKYWLRTIGINCTDQKLHSIAQKNESAAIQLFYQVYVVLNTKTKLNSLINKNIETPPSRKALFPNKLHNVCEVNPITKSKSFKETRAIVDWHKNRYTQLLQRCTAAQNEFIGIAEEVPVKKPEVGNQLIEMTVKKPPCPETLVENPNLQMKIVDGKCICDVPGTKQYVKHIRQKYANIDKVRKQQRQMHKLFLSEMMAKLIETEDSEFKEIITRKLLKQSHYEKQLTSKLIDVRHQKNVILENLRQEHEIVTRRKEYDYAENFFQQKTNLTLREQRFIKNYHRQVELHRRLWAEKQRKRYEKHYAMCNEIVDDFIDLAVKTHEYRCTYRRNVPEQEWRKWRALFMAAQPIFDVVDDVTEILHPDEAEYDETLSIELYRQSGMDDADLQDYLTLNMIWNLEPIDFYTQHFEEIGKANQILGYVVHRLLKLKYPCPPPHPVPELPPTDIRAVLIGVSNNELVTNLQDIFATSRVNIIDMSTVINFCLNTYLNECIVDVDEKLNSESKKGGKGKGGAKKNKKGAKVKDKKSKITGIVECEHEAKQTQTPKIFPDEELTFSKPAELGKITYETINLGLEIDNFLLLDMLIEYLKRLKSSKGWVLVNFPETITQACAFEEIFTGRAVPKELNYFDGESEDELDYEERDAVFSIPEDPYELVRLSKLLPDPQPSCRDKYASFFTSVVRLVIRDFESIESEISEFYRSLSIGSVLPYEKVDYELLREVVRLLSKDEVFAQKIYEDLLSGAIKVLKEKAKKAKEGAVNGKKGKKDKGKDKGKDKKMKKVKEEEQEPEAVANEIVVWEEEFVEPPRPGEDGWEYVDLPLTVELSKLLASTWQKAEDVYIRDFKEMFFTKRTYDNQIIPYVQQIETHMQEYIERPDKKQDHIHEFQKIYNDLDQDLREDDEFKADLHNRLTEFRDKLWNICDSRMKESEDERVRIINDNWFGNHTSTVTNLYLKTFQLELDRCHASLQVLQDYYTAMTMKIPIEIYLPIYVLNDFDAFPAPANGKKSAYEKAIFSIANIFGDKTSERNNPFVKFLKTSIESTGNYLSQWQTLTTSAIKAVQAQFATKPGKIERKPKKGAAFNDADFDVFEKVEKMIDEWTAARDGEILRTQFRLKLLLNRATEDISENLNYGEQLFRDISDRIETRYQDEINCVDEACQLFARAIEACEPIQARLVISGTQFFIDQKNLFYPDEPFEYDYNERVSDNEFTIANLTKLFYVFRDLAPNGYMPERTFIYLLQDMVVQNKEDDYESPVPSYWRLLKYNDVSQLVRDLYGESEYVNWRDFLVWNLGLPYPTEYELLDAKQQFASMDPDDTEYVDDRQFSCVRFWFEDEFSDDYDLHRMRLIKELLQTMFVSSEFPNKFNYFLLLFYFCKDVENVIGFSKALELALGNLVCWDVDVGMKFEKVMWSQKCLEDRHHREVLSTVTSALDVIVGNVMEQIDTVSDILGVYSEHEADEIDDCTITAISDDELVGEEHAAAGLPSLVYFLDFDVLIGVITTSFPWRMDFQTMNGKSLRERLEEIFDRNKRPEFKNQVFMHEFLNDSDFVDVLSENAKFLEKIPSEVVRRLVEVCTCEYKSRN